LLCRDPARIAVIYADQNGRFVEGSAWQLDTPWCTHAGSKLYSGDFNGDGRLDLMCKDPRRLWFNYADQDGRFSAAGGWTLDTAQCTRAGASVSVADFNGDGRSDLLCRDPQRLSIDFATADGRFRAKTGWSRNTTWCTDPQAKLFIADVNGDSRQDLLCRTPTALQIDYASIGPKPAQMGLFER
jgi:hypothetical protein